MNRQRAFLLERLPLKNSLTLPRYEKKYGKRADAHLCVTKAMQQELAANWGIHAIVLYDKPPAFFKPACLEERHKVSPASFALRFRIRCPSRGESPRCACFLVTSTVCFLRRVQILPLFRFPCDFGEAFSSCRTSSFDSLVFNSVVGFFSSSIKSRSISRAVVHEAERCHRASARWRHRLLWKWLGRGGPFGAERGARRGP